jgi:pyridoxamine 5'-phosphate oxidase
VKNRRQLDAHFVEYRRKFSGRQVPRPPYWGGFRLLAKEIEFWQARPNRLHDRIVYRRRHKTWKISRLNP